MSRLEIRLATPREVETVVRILNEANDWIVELGQRPWNARPWGAAQAAPAIARGETYLAVDGGHAIATLTLQPADETIWPGRPSDALYVHRFAVERAAHGRHVGRDLLDFAARIATEDGKRYLRLDCHCDNPRLRAYYIRLGFAYLGDRTVGTAPRTYCASLLEKAL